MTKPKHICSIQPIEEKFLKTISGGIAGRCYCHSQGVADFVIRIADVFDDALCHDYCCFTLHSDAWSISRNYRVNPPLYWPFFSGSCHDYALIVGGVTYTRTVLFGGPSRVAGFGRDE